MKQVATIHHNANPGEKMDFKGDKWLNAFKGHVDQPIGAMIEFLAWDVIKKSADELLKKYPSMV